ncbi:MULTISPECIES: hypothetical protein [Kamptonema]|uniref:hypothetical protein n=1 Tax=Kamptonema TaxID=1501433 RepID=UPI0001DAC136|nr:MULTISPECIES: hypothetical protein [Kamptonema]CBN56620.1 exported hypothetical protein [Kamptonema sp. PCC 6506]
MIRKLLTSAATGAALISAVLLYYDFNPLHNERWLLTAAAIAATGTLTAELSTRKKPKKQIEQLLKQQIRQLPYGSEDWQHNLDLLIAVQNHESPKNGQP